MTLSDHQEIIKHRRITVLLVEDDKPLLEFFSTVLKREGYSVIPAENGLEALELAQSEPLPRIDILFSDVAMPYMGGIQLAMQLRESRPNLRVLLTSGLPFKEVIHRCGPNFESVFLAKPFSVSDLANKVRDLATAA